MDTFFSGKSIFSGPFELFHVALEFAAGTHDLVAAAGAAQAEVRADAQDEPALGATGMSFFHDEDIADADVHIKAFLLTT